MLTLKSFIENISGFNILLSKNMILSIELPNNFMLLFIVFDLKITLVCCLGQNIEVFHIKIVLTNTKDIFA